MNDRVKKYLRVSGTLGAIAGVSALLLGFVNALTAPRIEQNAINKQNAALMVPFGEDVQISADSKDWTQEKPAPKYVVTSWKATKNGASVGTLYKANGTNSYGSISLLIGVYDDGSLTNMSILENTESYKTTLEGNYIDVYNKASKEDKEAALANVQCGATFGATTINEMVTECKLLSSGGVNYYEDLEEDGIAAFADAANMYQTMDISSYMLEYVKKGYVASKDAYESVVGNLFYIKANDASMYLAINSDGTYHAASVAKESADHAELTQYVTGFNKASDKTEYFMEVDMDGSELGTKLNAACIEALSLVNGTAKQDDRLACFDAGEVDTFTELEASTDTNILHVYEASLSGTKVAYVYDMQETNDFYGKEINLLFSVYADGSLGKINLVKDDSSDAATLKGDADYVKAFNAATNEEKNVMLEQDISGSTYSGYCIKDMLKRAIQDQKGR